MGDTSVDEVHDDPDDEVETEPDAGNGDDGKDTDKADDAADVDDAADDGDDDPAKGDDAGDGKGKKPSEADDGDDKKEPPTRTTRAEFIRGKVNERAVKRAAKAAESDGGKSGDGDDDDADDGASAIDPKIQKAIDAGIKAAVDPILTQDEENEINSDVDKYLASPEAEWFPKELADKLRVYATHPSRRQVPIEEIALGLAGRKTLVKYGAIKERQASKKAIKTQGGGSSKDTPGGNKKVWEMTGAEFAAEQQRVLRNGGKA